MYTYDLLPRGREDKNTTGESAVSGSKRFHLRSRNFKKCVYNGRVRVLTTWIGLSESDIRMYECVNKTYDLLISFFYTHVRATYFVFKITTMNRRSTRFFLFFLLS